MPIAFDIVVGPSTQNCQTIPHSPVGLGGGIPRIGMLCPGARIEVEMFGVGPSLIEVDQKAHLVAMGQKHLSYGAAHRLQSKEC